MGMQPENLCICLVGGIYGKEQEYRAKVPMTPETVLEAGLTARGHRVITRGHRHPMDLRGLDIVHVHHLGYGAIRVATSSHGTPFVYTSHSMAGTLSRLRRWAADFVMSRADAIVALSPTEAALQRDTYSLGEAMHAVIANGVDTVNFRYIRNNHRGRGRPWQLLFVGQLIELKGVALLLQALAMLPTNIDLQLVFHVDTLRNDLECLARRLGLQDRVRFLGSKSPSELSTLYQRADLLVLPSLSEALPTVLSEAMACGTPIVATNVGGVRDQLNGHGVIVPPGQTVELAGAISYVLDDYSHFADKGEAMSLYAQRHFSIPAMVDKHIALYRSLLERKAPRRRQHFHVRPLNIAARVAASVLCKM
jgi:glycosyltransferase involved in cell wall biosynthesis